MFMTAILQPKAIFAQQLFVTVSNVTIGCMTDADELTAFAARLNSLLDAMNVPPKGKARQTAVAKNFDVSQNGARKWLEAEGYPTLAMCKRIAAWANVQVEWLLTGRGDREIYTGGPRYVAERPAAYQPIRRSPYELSRLVAKLDADHPAIKMLDAVIERTAESAAGDEKKTKQPTAMIEATIKSAIDVARGNPETSAIVDAYVQNAAGLTDESMRLFKKQIEANSTAKKTKGSATHGKKRGMG
jgi:transcriptional regulator with XRE-family HTH domain